MKRFIEKTSYFLLMIITLLALAACVLRFVGFDNYIVVSGSMEPNIPTGSFAVVNRNVDFDDVKIGDVIVFKYEEMNIIHRVIETTTINGKKYFKTKGDANKIDDGFIVTEENYCGTEVYFIAKLGYAVDFTHQIKK